MATAYKRACMMAACLHDAIRSKVAHALPHLGCWASGGGGGAEPTASGTLTAAAACVVLDAALVAMPPDL